MCLAAPEAPLLGQIDSCNENAYKLILGDGIKVFDLSSESEPTRERYDGMRATRGPAANH